MNAVFPRLSSIVLFLLLVPAVSHAAPRAAGGILDLSDWDFDRDGIVTLAGEWEFYGRAFIPPDAFRDAHLAYEPGFVLVPGSWNELKDLSGTPMGSDGFATYRLQIRLPAAGAASTQPDELSIFIPYVNTSYKLWVDGELLASNGIAAQTPSEAKPQFRPEIARFRPAGGDVDVVLHISNFHFREGGISRHLELGKTDQIALKQRRLEIFGGALLGANLIMAIFFAGIYALQRESPADGYFSLFVLCIATRMLVTGDHILARVTTEIPWEIALKVEYLTGFIGSILSIYYLRALFPHDVSPRVVRVWTAIGVVSSIVVILFPGRVSSRLIPPFLLLLAGLLLYCVYVGFRAAIYGRPDSRLFLGGLLTAIGASLVTLLRYTGIAAVTDIIPVGIIVLVLSQSLVLAARSARTYRQTITLAAENARMLKETEWQLEKIKEYRRLMTLREENLRRHIAEMLHGRTQGRLFSALRRISQAEKAMAQDIPAAKEYLADAKALIDQVREEDIRSTGKKLHPAAVGAGIVAAIESLLDTFEECYAVQFDVDPEVEAIDQSASGGFAYDLRLGLYRIIEEGLNNIARHAQAQTISLTLSLRHREDGDFLELTLTDDGIGLDPGTSSKDGLGLPTIDARVSDLGGEWRLTGAPGQGTTMTVSIPLTLPSPA